ncbi:hypothetical protein WJX74_004442 [Apatococcus lobatus]|uniref:Uncharacterized protein n=1 Tax=Apatococcus lobatus TaxID=904363 RepID=A0AAW1Q635_9CHLO
MKPGDEGADGPDAGRDVSAITYAFKRVALAILDEVEGGSFPGALLTARMFWAWSRMGLCVVLSGCKRWAASVLQTGGERPPWRHACLHTALHTDASYKRYRARQHYAFMRCQTKAKRIAVRLVMDLETDLTGAERPPQHPLVASSVILKRYVPNESLTAISNMLQAHLGSDMYWSGYNSRWRLMCKSVGPPLPKDMGDKEGYRRARIMNTGRKRDYRLEYMCYYSLPKNARKNDARHRARYRLSKKGMVARGDHRVIHHRNGNALDNRAAFFLLARFFAADGAAPVGSSAGSSVTTPN